MTLKGKCNQCGACCYVGDAKCTNLLTDGARAECAIYANRIPGMAIILRKPDGSWLEGVCNHQLPKEEDILAQLITDGICSMEISNG